MLAILPSKESEMFLTNFLQKKVRLIRIKLRVKFSNGVSAS